MDSDDPQIPEPLRDELRAVYRRPLPVSPALDQRILNSARASLLGRNRRRLLIELGGVAAAVLIGFAMLLPVMRSADGGHRMQRAQGDVNNDGKVDIRDALLLARAVESRTAAVNPWTDLNGDKAVDRKDVDAIAMAAVRLKPGAVQ